MAGGAPPGVARPSGGAWGGARTPAGRRGRFGRAKQPAPAAPGLFELFTGLRMP
eukprot:COSAG04_NODE_1754_length_5687_cov_2.326593_9_plen_54_part_00